MPHQPCVTALPALGAKFVRRPNRTKENHCLASRLDQQGLPEAAGTEDMRGAEEFLACAAGTRVLVLLKRTLRGGGDFPVEGAGQVRQVFTSAGALKHVTAALHPRLILPYQEPAGQFSHFVRITRAPGPLHEPTTGFQLIVNEEISPGKFALQLRVRESRVQNLGRFQGELGVIVRGQVKESFRRLRRSNAPDPLQGFFRFLLGALEQNRQVDGIAQDGKIAIGSTSPRILCHCPPAPVTSHPRFSAPGPRSA